MQFLEGKYKNVLDGLHKEMERYAENMEFEKAARCRDKIRRIEQIGESRRSTPPTGRPDVVAEASDGVHTCFSILSVRSGK